VLAAWFHDTGYTIKYEDNEELGAGIAEDFLKENNYPREKIDAVKKCILSTKVPQQPENLPAKVLCDADMAGLGMKGARNRNELIRIEREKVLGEKIPEKDWLENTLKFLRQHEYHTTYAENNFGPKKKKSLKKFRKQLKKMTEKKDEAKDKLKDDPLLSNKPPRRGIETMFRNNLRGHLDLSGLADNKANIMLSINAIVISIVISALVPRLYVETHLVIPTAILLFVCVTTIVFATIATRPKVTEGTFRKEDVENKTANLLFFGNFHKMKQEDFEWAVKEMMKDREFLYGSMIRDFYNLGVVLHRKYKYLRICYTFFMFGIISAVLAFAIAFITH
jgi:uncharacterized membrane protein